MAFFASCRKVVTHEPLKRIDLPYTIIPDSETVYINGLEQEKGPGLCYTTYEGNKIIFNDDVVLRANDVVQVKYQRD